ncbi:hypothetical protein ACJX0J_034084, partial [Zea mays]
QSNAITTDKLKLRLKHRLGRNNNISWAVILLGLVHAHVLTLWAVILLGLVHAHFVKLDTCSKLNNIISTESKTIYKFVKLTK